MYNLYDFKAKQTDEDGPFLTQRIGDDGKVTYVIMPGKRQTAAPTSSLANGEGGSGSGNEGDDETNTEATRAGEDTASPQGQHSGQRICPSVWVRHLLTKFQVSLKSRPDENGVAALMLRRRPGERDWGDGERERGHDCP